MTLLVETLPVTLALMTQLTPQETINPRFGGKKPVISQTNTGQARAYLPRSGTKTCTIFACPIVMPWLTAASLSAMVDLATEWKSTMRIMNKHGALLKTSLITIQTRQGPLSSGSTPMAIEETWKVTTIDAQLQWQRDQMAVSTTHRCSSMYLHERQLGDDKPAVVSG